MADETLSNPVIIQATRLDTAFIPPSFPLPLKLYLVQQGGDMGVVANKANQAGNGAYDAQIKNDEQDKELKKHSASLAEHGRRIQAAELTIKQQDERLVAAEGAIVSHESQLSAIRKDISENAEWKATIESDYISKSKKEKQSIASPLDTEGFYAVNGVKVIGERVGGFTAMTGTSNKEGINADTKISFSDEYTKEEIEELQTLVTKLAQRCKAYEDALRQHGLID